MKRTKTTELLEANKQLQNDITILLQIISTIYQSFKEDISPEDIYRFIEEQKPILSKISELPNPESFYGKFINDYLPKINDYRKVKGGRKTGNIKSIESKKSIVEQRKAAIEKYLKENPNPDTGGCRLEAHLIDVLNLTDAKGKELSERTVSRYLKKKIKTHA